jgi:hypothetical protein
MRPSLLYFLLFLDFVGSSLGSLEVLVSCSDPPFAYIQFMWRFLGSSSFLLWPPFAYIQFMWLSETTFLTWLDQSSLWNSSLKKFEPWSEGAIRVQCIISKGPLASEGRFPWADSRASALGIRRSKHWSCLLPAECRFVVLLVLVEINSQVKCRFIIRLR